MSEDITLTGEYTIRRAEQTEEDYKKIVNMGARFAMEHSMGKLSAQNHDLKKALQWVVENVAYAAWLVEDEHGEPLGSISLHEDTTWYSTEPYLTDGWFYVVPEKRDSGIGIMLLETVKEFAKDKGLPLMVGVFNMKDALRTSQMLQRHGFTMAGGLFMAGE